MTPIEKIVNPSFNDLNINVPAFNSRFDRDLTKSASNVSFPKIKKINSYDVDINIQRLKHNKRETFAPLIIVFDSYESVKSFNVSYEILTGNIPTKETGNYT